MSQGHKHTKANIHHNPNTNDKHLSSIPLHHHPHHHPRHPLRQPPRNPSPEPQDPHELQRTHLPPYPHPHTSARKHA
ncbi:hypothetical protein Hanom_Chr09g00792841 [Helianthus anomalus]